MKRARARRVLFRRIPTLPDRCPTSPVGGLKTRRTRRMVHAVLLALQWRPLKVSKGAVQLVAPRNTTRISAREKTVLPVTPASPQDTFPQCVWLLTISRSRAAMERSPRTTKAGKCNETYPRRLLKSLSRSILSPACVGVDKLRSVMCDSS